MTHIDTSILGTLILLGSPQTEHLRISETHWAPPAKGDLALASLPAIRPQSQKRIKGLAAAELIQKPLSTWDAAPLEVFLCLDCLLRPHRHRDMTNHGIGQWKNGGRNGITGITHKKSVDIMGISWGQIANHLLGVWKCGIPNPKNYGSLWKRKRMINHWMLGVNPTLIVVGYAEEGHTMPHPGVEQSSCWV